MMIQIKIGFHHHLNFLQTNELFLQPKSNLRSLSPNILLCLFVSCKILCRFIILVFLMDQCTEGKVYGRKYLRPTYVSSQKYYV